MTSILVILSLGISLAHAAWAPKPFEENIITEIAGTRVLNVDLLSNSEKQTLLGVLTALQNERKVPSIPSNRKMELDLATGLVELAQGNYKKAKEWLERVESNWILHDACLYFKAKTLRLLAQEATKLGNDSDAAKLCKEARQTLVELKDYFRSPFNDLQLQEYRNASLCYAKALVKNKQGKEAKELILSALYPTSDLLESDQESFAVILIKVLIDQEEQDLARKLLDESLSTYPHNLELKKLSSRIPSLLTVVIPKSEKPSVTTKEELQERKPKIRPEESLFKKAAALKGKKNVLPALDLLLRILKEFPGSLSAVKAGVKLQLIVENLLQNRKIPSGLIPRLKDLPSAKLYTLGKSFWEQELSNEAYELFKHLTDHYPFAPEAGNSIFFMGRIYEDRGEWMLAQNQFERLIQKYSSSSFFDRAQFKVGFLSYLMKEDNKAIEWFNNALASAEYPVQKAESLYWMSQVYERLGNQEQAKKLRAEIITIAPVSYYALLLTQIPNFVDSAPIVSSPKQFWTSYLLKRARAFLAVGLPKFSAQTLTQVEAQNDISTSKEIAILLNASRHHDSAISNASRLLIQSFQGEIPKDIAMGLFPIDYENIIFSEAKASKLDPLLLFALIKQESAYKEDAESRVGALGLMQLMPKTAAELSQALEETVPQREDLLMGSKNVKIGSKYLASLIKKYDGNLVCALAAYNAGTNRVDVWKGRWNHLPPEIFIELIPFEETRNYVKSILANYAYYAKFLENRTLELKDVLKLL